jgi:sec-independent protein translocase protein TatA
MGALEPWHLIVILVVALIVFGPGKVGELGGTLGKAVRDFREVSEGKTPATPVTPAASSQTCVNCRASIPAGSKFCPGCGLPAPTVTLGPTN